METRRVASVGFPNKVSGTQDLDPVTFRKLTFCHGATPFVQRILAWYPPARLESRGDPRGWRIRVGTIHCCVYDCIQARRHTILLLGRSHVWLRTYAELLFAHLRVREPYRSGVNSLNSSKQVKSSCAKNPEVEHHVMSMRKWDIHGQGSDLVCRWGGGGCPSEE